MPAIRYNASRVVPEERIAVATYDTLKFANTLKAAGVLDRQAEAQAVAFPEVIQINLKDLVTNY